MLVRAYDRCWFFGGDFGSKSFEQHFQLKRSDSEYVGYVRSHFDTIGYFNGTSCNNTNPSVIGSYANLITAALDTRCGGKLFPLPKLVVIVPDDDIIRILTDGDRIPFFGKSVTKLLNYIMVEHERAVASFKEFLSAKCVRPDFPQILWIQAPLHDNFKNNNLRGLQQMS